MAIFLLVYIVVLIIWLIWSLITTYHLVKYGFPYSKLLTILSCYWITVTFIVIVSILFIAKADWTTVPGWF
jgi:hypothetical protein